MSKLTTTAALSLRTRTHSSGLCEGNGSKLAFVGATDPVRGWRCLVAGTPGLANVIGSDLTIINTSGLLSGPGRRLKADKIAAIQPDLLVGIEGGFDLERII